MNNKTEITIEGDSIIYNGVKYQKVQEEPKKNTPNLTDIIADSLEDELMGHLDLQDALNEIEEISQHIVEAICLRIPNYSDWNDYLSKEFPNQTLPQEKSDLFRLGWNAYCKKMWDMINE